MAVKMIATYQFQLFADYHQFYLEDENITQDDNEIWTAEACEKLLAIAPGRIAIGTARNMTVPVTVEIWDREPDEGRSDWDKINDCGIDIDSGKLVILGCTDYYPDAARIELPPGRYHARIYYGGLETLSNDGLDGDDHYKIVLWIEPS